MLRSVRNFFRPVQYAQPYISSSIPTQRLDEDPYTENPFNQTSTGTAPQHDQGYLVNPQVGIKSMSRKRIFVTAIASISVSFLVFVTIYYAFSERNDDKSFLQSNNSETHFSMTFETEIDLKNTLVQLPNLKRYITRGNDKCTKAHRDLSVKCGLDINTCSQGNLKQAMSILMDRGFESTFDETKKYFEWYKNLSFFVISDVTNFLLKNESTITADLKMFFSYYNEGPEISGLERKNTTGNSYKIDRNEFMKSFEFLLSPCHWYEVKIHDVRYD